jgi:hypothetical protein
MAFKMTRPTIEGSPIHKASIAKAKARPVVSQSRTSADPSLVMMGDELGKSLIPGAIDYRITTPKIDWGKEKEKKKKKGKDKRELDDIYNDVPQPDMSEYENPKRYPYTGEGSFGENQVINDTEEDYPDVSSNDYRERTNQTIPVSLDRQDITVGGGNATPAVNEVNDEGNRILTGINANRGSDTTPSSTALPSGDVPTFSPEFGNLDVKTQSGQGSSAGNQEMEIQEQEYPEPDLLRKEILDYGTPNMFPKNERQQVTLPPTTPPSINNGGNVAPEKINKVDGIDIKEPTTVPLAENNRKYNIPTTTINGTSRVDVPNVDERGNQKPRFDEEGYNMHNDDQGNIMITYNGYEVDNYEEIPDGIFNAMTEDLNSGDGQGTESNESQDSTGGNNNLLPVIPNSSESSTTIGPKESNEPSTVAGESNKSKENTQEILDRGIIPNEEQKENVVYEKPSRFDYPVDMDEPSKGKINSKTKGISYNEAVKLYEEQENNSAVQQRTQSIFRNAIPGGKVQSKLKEEGFNPYKSI